jgi:long-chain acyl-CoA synthetase
MIVLANGLNVFPQDIEQVLRTLPGVKEAVVVGLPTERGHQVHAVLLLDSPTADAAAIVRQANDRMAPHQRITGWTVWTEQDFPRTHTLKIKKPLVLEAVQAMQNGAPAAAPPAPEPIGAPA